MSFFAKLKSGFGGSELGRGEYSYTNYNEAIEDYYITTSEITGEMTITKLDFEKHIVYGTFWFDILLPNGEIVEVREGRFDMQFTQ